MSAPGAAPQESVVPRYGLYEIAFEARERPADSFGIQVAARFRADTGRELVVPAYFDSGAAYRLRFWPPGRAAGATP
jgi:hypothetical protein